MANHQLTLPFAFVIIAGSLALVELLRSNLAIMLLASLSIVYPLSQQSRQSDASNPSSNQISRYIDTKCLPSISRALRNHTVALGDFVWGHMWGVGVEIKTDPLYPAGAETSTTSTSANGMKGSAKKEAKGKGAEVDGMDVDLGVNKEPGLTRVDDVQQQAVEVLTGIFKVRRTRRTYRAYITVI